MKTRTKTLLAVLMLLSISCKKESTVQSSGVTDESSTQSPATDIDKSEFASVKIGRLVVMKKNLNVSRYRNGDRIPQVKDPAAWASITTGAWCYYNNDPANGPIYGKLYNWYAVNDPRGLAPEGWHIPSDEEWTAGVTSLGGELIAGGKMKATGTIEAGTGLWYYPNTGATNSSGFTGLPAGYRAYYGYDYNIGSNGYWWSSTLYDAEDAWIRELLFIDGIVYKSWSLKRTGHSVRCVKD